MIDIEKVKEALERIKTAGHNGMRLEYCQDFRTIKQALTPPTQEEVIEAIQNDIPPATCYYDGKRFNVVELFENGNVEMGMSINEIQIKAFSPSTLILIGRFYKSLESDEK